MGRRLIPVGAPRFPTHNSGIVAGLIARDTPRVTSTTFVVDDVHVIRKLELGWLCEIEGKPCFVGKLQVVPGSSMPPEGKRGPMNIIASALQDLGRWHARCA